MRTGFLIAEKWIRHTMFIFPYTANSSAIKISSKYNNDEGMMSSSPLVGYSCHSSVNTTSSISFIQKHEKMNDGSKRGERLPRTDEITHKPHLREQKYSGYFQALTHVYRQGIYVICASVKKLLFDILKNLVTFTASNHCMYGEKRYN